MPQRKSNALIRTLSDLLQLDHDALRSYQVAIDALGEEKLKRELRAFRRDHQRHVRELTALIEANGGAAIELPHLSTGFVKVAVQFLGAAGGDRAVLLAFRSNEWEAAEKYAAAARRRYPAEVQKVISRAAADEQRHYRWAVESLEKMGAGDRTVIGRLEQLVERLHGGAALGLEALERWTVGAVSKATGKSAPKKSASRSRAGSKVPGSGAKAGARKKTPGGTKGGARKKAAGGAKGAARKKSAAGTKAGARKKSAAGTKAGARKKSTGAGAP